SLAWRGPTPGLGRRRSARTTRFSASPRGARRRASAAAARLARLGSQTRLAARVAEPPRPPLGSHYHPPRGYARLFATRTTSSIAANVRIATTGGTTKRRLD